MTVASSVWFCSRAAAISLRAEMSTQELDRALRLRAAAADERGGRPNPQRAAVLAQVALLDVQVRDLAAPQPLEAYRGGLEILRHA